MYEFDVTYSLYRFGPFISDIENNHPYLEGNSLQFLAQNKRLYVVDLSEVSLKDDLVRTC